MLKVWGRASSSNVQAAMWCIAELCQEFERFDVGHRFGKTDTPEFAALNPNRTVPVIQDGTDAPIWETGAILRYLATRYGSDSFWPKDAAERAQIDKWAEWAKRNVAENFTVPVFWRITRSKPDARDHVGLRHAVKELENWLSLAEAQLARHPFLAGASFTLADIQLGHVLYRYYDIDIERADLGNLRAYYDRLTDRQAYRDHVMLDYSELQV